jgi:hypothetical protein
MTEVEETFFVCQSCGWHGDYWNRMNYCREYCRVDTREEEFDHEYEFDEHGYDSCPECGYECYFEDNVVEVRVENRVLYIDTNDAYPDEDLLVESVCDYLRRDADSFRAIFINEEPYGDVEEDEDYNPPPAPAPKKKVTVWGW